MWPICFKIAVLCHEPIDNSIIYIFYNCLSLPIHKILANIPNFVHLSACFLFHLTDCRLLCSFPMFHFTAGKLQTSFLMLCQKPLIFISANYPYMFWLL